ncbi:MAG: VTT domain-containing protein [Polyangiaceae bacterium]
MSLPTADTKATSGRNGKIAAVVAALVMLFVAYELGVFEQVRNPAALAKSLVAMGAWGYVAFVVTYAAVQPFGVPGTIFVFGAALIWPWPIAFALSMLGTMAASIIGFSFARFVARDWISSRIPQQFKKYDEALVRRAFVTVILMRLIFWMPPLLHAFFGVSKVRFWTHVWGSLIGYIIPLFLMSFFGQKLWRILKGLPPSVWIEAAIGIVAISLGVMAWRRSRRQSVGS